MSTRSSISAALLASGLAAFVATPASAGQPDSEGDFPKTGLVFWVSAEQVEVGADNTVKSMKDRSGNANPALHLGNGNDQGQPKLDIDPVSTLPVMSFSGSITGLGFNRISDIRTAFWILSKDTSRDGNCEERTAFGDSTSNDFHVGCKPDSIFNVYADAGHTSPYVADGKTYLHGVEVDPKVALFPAKLGLISVVTTGNCRANQIGKDRGIGRSWIGNIAEILVYNVPLSDADRKAVENHFIGKYGLPGKRGGGLDAGIDASAMGDACCASETSPAGGTGGAATSNSTTKSGTGGGTGAAGGAGGTGGGSAPAAGTSNSGGRSGQSVASSATTPGSSCTVGMRQHRQEPGVFLVLVAAYLLMARRRHGRRSPQQG